MANYNWRVGNGAFGTAADWTNTTTGDNPALMPPGAADVANLVGAGGTVTGTGSVDQINIYAATNPWVLAGTFTALQLGGNAGFSLASGAKLTLTGRANSNPANLPYSGNFVGIVTATGAVIDSSGSNLTVGNGFGATPVPGALTLGGGSTMTALNLGIGQGATATVTVDGVGSSLAVVTKPGLTYASILAIGQNYTPSGQAAVHGTGHLVVTNGASVTADTALQVGADAGASGDVTIGSGASVTVHNRTTVGGNGTGSLAISGGGTLTTATNGATSPSGSANYDFVGDGAGSVGTVTIDGAGSKWTSGYQFIIGNFGSGAVTVGNGGALATAQLISGQLGGSMGQLTVNAGGTVTSANSIVVGNTAGSQGGITVNAGGVLRNTAPAQTVGYLTLIGENDASGGQANAMGTLTVNGPGALFDAGLNGLILGASGSGSLTISAGGRVISGTIDSNSAAALAVARNAGSVATITITGVGSTLDAKGGAYVGRAGKAILTVDQGGTFIGGSTATGDGIGANAAFGVTIGDGPFTPTTDPFNGTATAQVTNASTLRSRTYLEVGNRGGVGAMLVDGGSLVTADQQVRVGTGTTNPNARGTVTVQGASTLQGGGAWARGSASINVGRDASTVGVLTVASGSLLDGNGGRIAVGSAGAGTLNVTGGGRALAGAAYTDIEAALQVGAVAGGSGAVSVDGAGSQLIATGLAVIGGENLGAGVVAGGTGTVSVTASATFRATNLAMFAGSSITVDATATGEIGAGTQAVAAGRLTVDADGGLTGAGAVHAAVVDNGLVTAQGGTLAIDAVAGTGALLADGGTLDGSRAGWRRWRSARAGRSSGCTRRRRRPSLSTASGPGMCWISWGSARRCRATSFSWGRPSTRSRAAAPWC